jgi:two-component system sensor histidine kinase KdpD
MVDTLQLKKKRAFEKLLKRPVVLSDYLKAIGVVLLCTVVAFPVSHFVHPGTLILIYLIGIIVISNRWSRGAAMLACILSVLVYDYMYVPPLYHPLPNDREDVFTLTGMLVISILICSTATLLRNAAREANERERTERAIGQLNRAIAGTRTLAGLIEAGMTQVQASLGMRARIVLCAPDTDQLHEDAQTMDADFELASRAVSQRDTLSDARNETLYLPLLSGHRPLGVIIVTGNKTHWDALSLHLLHAMADQLSLGIERASGLEAAERAKMQVEGVKLRNALLSSVSHDLRTPLASIMGAASTILADESLHLPQQHRELLHSIQSESDRLAKFLKNLLDMTRIESGAVRLMKEWQSIEESVGVALNRLRLQLAPFKVVTALPDDLPLSLYDEQLIDQVLFNLLDNAGKYAPPGSEIKVWAKNQDEGLTVGVSNTGCSLAEGAEAKIFDKFYRGDAPLATYGAGLGLTICKGIMQAHAGQIWAERFDVSGITICFWLPRQGEPPAVLAEELENLEPENA